jgi:hypothetical protein
LNLLMQYIIDIFIMFFVNNLSLPLPTLECQNLNGGELSSFLDTHMGSPKRMHLKWREASTSDQ